MNIPTKLRHLLLKGAVCLALFFAFTILSFCFIPKAYAEPNQQTGGELAWTKPGSVRCDWQNASMIKCDGFVFAFSIAASKDAGYAIFQLVPKGSSSSSKGSDSLTDGSTWYLHLSNGSSTEAFISKSSSQPGEVNVENITSDNQSMKKLLLASGGPNEDNPDGIDTIEGDINFIDDKGLHKDGNGNPRYAICGLYTEDGHTCFSMLGQTNGMKAPFNRVTLTDPDNKIAGIKEALFTGMDSRDDCTQDSGSLGFVLCPILETANNAVKKMIGSDGSGRGFLVELLTITPLEQQKDGAETDIYKTWKTIRDVALGLYVLLFVIIVFGNGVGYDPYTIKKALPKLAAGALLTWASFFIMQTLVDFSNLVGTAVPSLIAVTTDNAGIKTYDINMSFGIGGLTIILAIILTFVALGALLIGIAGLLARAIIIYGLVLLAPIAFAAWVLPNTESLFKKWWKNLIKVLMMFPIVTGMLAISLLFQASIDQSASMPLQIASSLAPLIAIIMIPKTFKWGGEAFAAAAGYMAGKASGASNAISNAPKTIGGKAIGSAKERAMASDKVAAFTGGMASSRLGRLAGGKAAMRASGRARGRMVGEAESLTKNMTDDQLIRTAKVGSYEERVAAIGALAKRRNRGKLSELSREGGKTARAYDDASGRYAGDFGPNTDLRRAGGKYSDVRDMSVDDAVSLGSDGFAAGLATGAISYSTAQAIYNNDKVRTSLSKQKLRDLTEYLSAGGAVDSNNNPIRVQGANSRTANAKLQGVRPTENAEGKHVGERFEIDGNNNIVGSLQAAGRAGRNGSPPPPVGGPSPAPTGGSSPQPSGGGAGTGGGSSQPAPGPRPAPPPPPSGGVPTYTTPAGAPRYTTSGVPIPPPPSGNPPTYSAPPPPPPAPGHGAPPPPPPPSGGSTTPPPYRGPAPAWQPAPRQSPPPSPSSSSGSSGPASSAGGTVINNVTNNNSTTNSTTNNNSVKTVLNSNGVPSSIALGTASQLGNIKKRFSEGSAEHSGLAGIESKLNDLGRMIQSGSLSQTRLRDNVRDIHRDIDSLPPGAHDQQANLRGVLDNIERNATDDEV